MLRKLWAAWGRFLFQSDSPAHVVWGRFCVYGLGTLYLFFVRDHHPETFTDIWHPISFYQLLSGPISYEILSALRWVWFICGLLAAFGVAFGIAAPLCFIAGTALYGHSYNFGVVYHSTHLYVMCLGLMILTWGLAPVGIRLTKMYVVYFFCYCGIQKLCYSGLDWAFSDSFYLRLVINPEQTRFAGFLMQQPLWVSMTVAAYSIFCVELLAPLAFINKKMGLVYFFIWSTFHLGITLTFGNHVLFWSGISCYALFLPWDDIVSRFNLPEPRLVATKVIKKVCRIN